MRAAVRRLVLATGAEIVEPELTGSDTRCCGLGGLVRSVDPDLSAEIAAIRSSETDRTWLTYCAACRQALSAGASGAVHVAEFLLDRDWRRAARRGRPARPARYLRRLQLRWSVSRLGPSRPRGRRP
jgi:hypothetical protein